ncbi:protein-L-isoaspartate(D-aspartate) O-methyltransferase [Empedobacter stercoris]|uniref:Protein-L-isoaspartate O-methyltransferase n=2 Tax=Flavobacteriales TaxID=200644 RepID=A0ABX1WII3_9FLAO|nr:protein-L-isoaspartate(D-aspartate) O-methyltransferase [Empedobacter stercoris]MCA4783178.1 protein-L-isoaspartate(D-aspartate) O-methyltransferase [Empedobacter stercoris]MCA4810456.1 protein-L-isoaspartate(D-aspartate) O-methyltransferase [Empedobacter stercoris]NOJ74481.1 protein-L-isoaspartate(D-aspartate) O-methyltransferase [Empedobacter stercoris]QNT14930.1 protein-L-isoaspartate(D-aspartate) O-methyltransferase [Empedobacter stercoris]
MSVDDFKHRGRRKMLVDLLRSKGIEDENVLGAINLVPRHLFLDSAFTEFAYRDEAFPIAAGQTISHPFTVAFQTQLLDIQPNEKVLEIGTGSGYQTAVLVALDAEVFTIERQKDLFDFSKIMLKKINFEPRYQTYGDGYKGLPSFAPFDKIIVTAGAPEIPEELKKQLNIGGIMVIPVGEQSQRMIVIMRLSENQYEYYEFGDFKFVPMLESRDK